MKSPLLLANDEQLAEIGLCSVDASARKRIVLQLLDEYRKFSRSFSVMLETCTSCGICAGACHSYLGTDDFFNIPAARAGLLRSVFNRYFTWSGKFFRKFTGATDFDDRTLDAWLDYFYQCNVCRRCAVSCPFGIDTGEIVLAGRNILAKLGLVPRFLVNIARNELETGNNTGIRKAAVLDSCAFLEEELREETGLTIRIPVDKVGSEVLYVPSSSEFFVNVDTLMGAAKLFHCLGVDWTLSSSILEAANYGLLFDLDVMKKHNERMRMAAKHLGVKRVVQGECGHGWRAAKMFSEGANGPLSFFLEHVLDFVSERLDGLKLKKIPMKATLHDPCNYARGTGLVESPRRILRACVEEYAEMTPSRERNYCCGGGAGLLMDEMLEVRMRLGKMKADQIRALLPLDYVAVPCASCKAQMPLLLKHFGMGDVRVGGILELLGAALDMGACGSS